jgi:hypothetical protein
VQTQFNSTPIKALVDSGASVSVMSKKAFKTVWEHWKMQRLPMGGLVISRAACGPISVPRRTTAHNTVSSSVLCTGYVVNRTVSCVIMNMILVTII